MFLLSMYTLKNKEVIALVSKPGFFGPPCTCVRGSDETRSSTLHVAVTIDEYKKLHSLVKTNHRTKTANITKDDVTSASHRQKVTVLQK